MIDRASKKQKKVIITEEDISTLLPRYSVTKVLAMLQEVAQFEGVKIDWEALVKKTKTGICNAREYQMLWRHLAYRHPLQDQFDDDDDAAHPLDDDSDLEHEVEAFPEVTNEASLEAVACVKVLIASGSVSDFSHRNNATVEAPLTINIPNGLRAPSEHSQPGVMRGRNITVPVSVQKQHLPAVAYSEGLDVNGSASGVIPPRKKRKLWSEAEDMELIDAVKKYGEGNWATILRSEYKGDRTASQLSQRWQILRKKNNLNLGNKTSSSQLSEAQRATRNALNFALDPPARNIITNSSGGTTLNGMPINSLPLTTTESSPSQHQAQQVPIVTKSNLLGPLDSTGKPQVTLKTTLAKPTESSPSQNQAQQRPIMTKSTLLGPLDSTGKPQVTLKTTSAKPKESSTSQQQAQQRPIMTKSTSLGPLDLTGKPQVTLKTTLAKPTESTPFQHQAQQHPIVTKSTLLGPLDSTGKHQVILKTTSAKPNFRSDPVTATAVAAGARVVTQLDADSAIKAAKAKNAVHMVAGGASTYLDSFPNVHFISTGLAAGPFSTHPAASSGSCHSSVKACTSTQPIPLISGASSNKLSEQASTDLPPKQDGTISGEVEVSGSEAAAVKREVQKVGACVLGNELCKKVEEDRAALTTQKEAECASLAVAENSDGSLKLEMVESDSLDVIRNKTEISQDANRKMSISSPVKEVEDQSVVPENGENQIVSERQADLSSMVTDNGVERGPIHTGPADHCKNLGTEI